MFFIKRLKILFANFRFVWIPPRLTQEEKKLREKNKILTSEIYIMKRQLIAAELLQRNSLYHESLTIILHGCMDIINLVREREGLSTLDRFTRESWNRSNIPAECISLLPIIEEVFQISQIFGDQQVATELLGKFTKAINEISLNTYSLAKQKYGTRLDNFYITYAGILSFFVLTAMAIGGISALYKEKFWVANLNNQVRIFYTEREGEEFADVNSVFVSTVLTRNWSVNEVKMPKNKSVGSLRIDPFTDIKRLKTQIRNVEFLDKKGNIIKKYDLVISADSFQQFSKNIVIHDFDQFAMHLGSPPELISSGNNPYIVIKNVNLPSVDAVRYEIRVAENWNDFKE